MSGMNRDRDADLGPPPIWLSALEMPRMLLDMMGARSFAPRGRAIPEGDGHPVVVIPPLASDDGLTFCLRNYLGRCNYEVHGWGLGRNQGPASTGYRGEKLVHRIERIRSEAGRKLSLIGWSLGGIQARELAKGMPQSVRQVITLCSPFAGGANATHGSALLADVARDAAAEHAEEYADMLRHVPCPPPDIPCTAVFSKSDGISNWRACVERPGPLTDNVEVVAAHCAMGYNPDVLFAVADRLAVDPANWRPFDRETEAWRSRVYPSSGHQYGY